MAKLLSTDGTSKEIAPKNGKDFVIAELRELIGCEWIEVIYLNNSAYNDGDPNGDIMIGDEEARFNRNNTENPEATKIYRKSWDTAQNIVGPIVLCKSKELT